MRFPYTILPAKRGKCYKPLVPIVLNYKKTHRITPGIMALIDSGADVCFCSKKIGEYLNISFKKIKRVEKFLAANNKFFLTQPEAVNLKVAGKELRCEFHFTDVLPELTPIILGQVGFFDKFRIIFDVKKGYIEVK